MRTLRQFADLLAAADSPAGLAAIAATLGFVDEPQPLDHADRERLGLDTPRDAAILRGPGALRALLVVGTDDQPLRRQVGTVAAALSRHTAHVLWLVLATAGDEVAAACWTGDRHPPRVVALVAHRRRIVASDAESLAALATVALQPDDLLAHTRWCELLGREALTRRFYRTLEQRIAALAASLDRVRPADAAELALLTVSRLLFLCFLQAKGWLNGERGFLTARFDECMARGGGFHRRVLLPLFFGTLNTPMRRRAVRAREFGQVPFLNGGLFGRTALERRHPAARFADAPLGALFGDLLDAYRFTAREDDARLSEVAIDPAMLGRAFECLMAARERRVSGAFYTPPALVAEVADVALACALARGALSSDDVGAALAGRAIDASASRALRDRLRRFTVLDPACGSGAFLVHLLERLTLLHRAAGDARPIATIRREVLALAIHGVDVNPTAVWLCELRLWLCVVIESDETRMSAVTPLPNLDCNVRVGDALAGDAFEMPPSLVGPSAAHARLRERYARATGPRKLPLRRALAREERRRALAAIDRSLAAVAGERRERLLARRGRDLFGNPAAADAGQREQSRRLRRRAAALRRERSRIADGGALPFSFPSHFGHVHAAGGFGLVVGNPPWVRLHNIPPAARAALRERFAVFRDAGWKPPLPGIPATTGFGTQPDLAALFVERSVALAARGGTLALLLPAKLWRSLSGGGVRRLLARSTRLHAVVDWTDAPGLFEAAVYPSCLVASRDAPGDSRAHVTVRRGRTATTWTSGAGALRFDDDPASPWLLLPPDVRASWQRLTDAGPPLGTTSLGRPTLGVKCGCNDAFTVHVAPEDGAPCAHEAGRGMARVEHLGRRGCVERALLRPLLRGDAVTAWTIAPSPRAIVWTHGADGAALRSLPPGAARWLAPWRHRLDTRTDLHGARAWWMLFRTEAADPRGPRVVWGDLGRAPRAALLPAGDRTVPLNSCYAIACDDVVDALALTALVNTPVAAAWLDALAEPARGGWHRYLAWTVSLLPLPGDWPRARRVLAPLAERAMSGLPPDDDALVAAACEAYALCESELAPLLAWGR